METIRLSSKGQFVIPKTIRDFHHWGPGTELIVIDTGTEVVIRQHKPFAETKFESPDLLSAYRGPTLSLEDMDRAVAIEAGKHR